MTDLLTLIGTDTKLTKVASTRGGEYAGPCPWCGGKDRLRVQPEQGRWWCRQCDPDGLWQDAIAYIRRRDNLTYAEALERLGEPAGKALALIPPAQRPQPQQEPTLEWRRAAGGVVERCEAALWSTAGRTARAYLEQRGIRPETVRAARLGYQSADATVAGLFVPAGITLPWFAAGELWAVKVRRRGQPRYSSVPGGHPYVYNADALAGRSVAVLCEGEFDALLLGQEAGDLAAAVTFGGASVCPNDRQTAALQHPIRRILVAYDTDTAGEAGAGKLCALSRRMARVRVPQGKDLTEFHLAGGNLRRWLQWELLRLARPQETAPAVCEVPGCGGVPWLGRDPETGGYCREHVGRLQLLNAASLLGWPERGAAGWREYARTVADPAAELARLWTAEPVGAAA